MKNEYLQQAMMEVDDELIAAAARPMAKKSGTRWPRVALVAACLAALMAVTAVAGARVYRFTFRQLDERRLAVEVEQPAPPITQPAAEELPNEDIPAETNKPSKDYTKFDQVYLPTEFPGEATLQSASRVGSEHWLTGYKWEWKINGKTQMIFRQHRLGSITYGAHTSMLSTVTYETGEMDVGGIPVGYVITCNNGDPMLYHLMWSDEAYQYDLRYGRDATLEDLAKVILSLQPTEPEVYNALLNGQAPEEADPDRAALQQVLLPGQVPEGLTFLSDLKADACTWYLEYADDYRVEFYQEDADSPAADRRLLMQDNPYLADAEVAGKPMQLLGGKEGEYLYEYFWEQDGNWCSLAVDKAIADRLGMTMEELAEQLVEDLVLTPAADAQAAMDALK